MECQSCDSKKLFKVFDASKRKRARKKRDGMDDTNSVNTDDSNSACHANICRRASAKASLQELFAAQTVDVMPDTNTLKRDLSSPSITRSPMEIHRSSRSPRRHHRSTREGISLALKAGLASTPRSVSPLQEREGGIQCVPRDQDSFIYAFLEEAVKRDKKKHRHGRRKEDRVTTRDRDASVTRDQRHRHRRHRDDVPSREYDKPARDKPETSVVEQAALFETFAKLCVQMNGNSKNHASVSPVPRTQSHKSLQCEVLSRRDSYNIDRHPIASRSPPSRDDVQPIRIRSQANFRDRLRSHEQINNAERKDKCGCFYEKDAPKYPVKVDVTRSKINEERYREYQDHLPRYCVDKYRGPDQRDSREYDRRHYDEDKRRYCEQKTSRSFEVRRDRFEEERCRRTVRSDNSKHYDEIDKRFDDRREECYAEKPDRFNKERRCRRHLERIERNSVASREDDYRDKFSERERDSGLSVADENISTISGRSNYLRVVKQEITEQRDTMDKMMKLWKELMRCFKGISQTQGPDKAANESASNVRESAAAQLRLWRECMRRYETVARDVGDTDARLMEEINKQRSEMAEMASMWQECLQRYRDMSNDFNSLKQKLATSESPPRAPAPVTACAEGEGTAPPPHYRLPHNYPPPMPPIVGYPQGGVGSPLRPRASAPPAWWWAGSPPPRSPHSPRRRSSPDSRASRERDRRHRHKDRDDSRYKTTKPGAARSEHRHRKR